MTPGTKALQLAATTQICADAAMSDMPLHHDRQFAAYGINCSASDSLGAKGHDQYIRVLVLYHEGKMAAINVHCRWIPHQHEATQIYCSVNKIKVTMTYARYSRQPALQDTTPGGSCDL
ncbi:hypothetical protein ABBQ38_001473 [Trebouxia sp. C0009 RCD-2024]